MEPHIGLVQADKNSQGIEQFKLSLEKKVSRKQLRNNKLRVT